jgi:rare lipoprotein A
LIVAGLAIAGFAAFSPQPAPERSPSITNAAPGGVGQDRGAATGRVLALAFAMGTRERHETPPALAQAAAARAAEDPQAGSRPQATTTSSIASTVRAAVPTPATETVTTIAEPTIPRSEYQWPSGARCQASWYGPGFEGQPTASGEPFDPKALTAAMHDLPFGTLVVVTNVETGADVVVRVNDRGPFVWDNGWHRHAARCIDLSRAAMESIATTGDGIAEVTIRY